MQREASVRLTLDNSNFLVSIKRTGDQVDRTGEKGKRAGKAFEGAFKSARGAIDGLGRSILDATKLAATLGGAFTVGNALHDAVKLQATYRQLAFAISTATGEQVKAADVQRDVERAAADTTRSSAEMVAVFGKLRDETGDAQFARDSLEAIGHTANATGKPIEALADIAATLHEKFGVAGKEMAERLAQVVDQTSLGGPKLEDFAAVASQLGSNLLEAGLEGQRGLDFMLGALNAVDDKSGDVNKSVRGISQVLLNLGKGSEMKTIAKSLAIDPKTLINEKDAIARLMKILSFGKKGIDALEASFTSAEERKALGSLFVDPFKTAIEEAKASGLKGKNAIDQALGVLESRIENFGEANLNAAAIRAESAEAVREPEARLREALERLNTAFSQPQVIDALDQLSEALPALAVAISDVVAFISNNLPGADKSKKARVVDDLTQAGRAALDTSGSFEDRQRRIDKLKSAIKKNSATPSGVDGLEDFADDPMWGKRISSGLGLKDYKAPSEQMAEQDASVNAKARERAERLQAALDASKEQAALLPPPEAKGRAPVAQSVSVDNAAAARVGIATATALGGKVLNVRVANLAELGGRTAGSSGSRGPTQAPAPRSGGGH